MRGMVMLAHSMTLLVQPLRDRPRMRTPSTVPCIMVLHRLSCRVTWPNHASFRRLTMARRGLWDQRGSRRCSSRTHWSCGPSMRYGAASSCISSRTFGFRYLKSDTYSSASSFTVMLALIFVSAVHLILHFSVLNPMPYARVGLRATSRFVRSCSSLLLRVTPALCHLQDVLQTCRPPIEMALWRSRNISCRILSGWILSTTGESKHLCLMSIDVPKNYPVWLFRRTALPEYIVVRDQLAIFIVDDSRSQLTGLGEDIWSVVVLICCSMHSFISLLPLTVPLSNPLWLISSSSWPHPLPDLILFLTSLCTCCTSCPCFVTCGSWHLQFSSLVAQVKNLVRSEDLIFVRFLPSRPIPLQLVLSSARVSISRSVIPREAICPPVWAWDTSIISRSLRLVRWKWTRGFMGQHVEASNKMTYSSSRVTTRLPPNAGRRI